MKLKLFVPAILGMAALSAPAFAAVPSSGAKKVRHVAMVQMAAEDPVLPGEAPQAVREATIGHGSSYLGVDIEEVTQERVAPLKLKEERGVEITMVDQDAPAGKAGLKEHDVILDFNGTPIEGQEQLRRLLRETPSGRTVALGISRDGQPMQIKVTLADRQKVWSMSRRSHSFVLPPGARGFVMPAVPPMPPMPEIDIPWMSADGVVRSYSTSTGMMVDNLTPQLADFFGVKSGHGVLVRSVEKGSVGEAAGLKAGDVIVKVNTEDIADRNDWRRALRGKSGKVNLGVVREKREQSLTLTLPERKSKDSSKVLRHIEIPDADENFDMDMDIDIESSDLRSLNDELPALRLELDHLAPQVNNVLDQLRVHVAELENDQDLQDLQRVTDCDSDDSNQEIDLIRSENSTLDQDRML